jgi:hypothetical protein
MIRTARTIFLVLAPAAWILSYAADSREKAAVAPEWLWVEPTNLESRDMVYGLGSAARAPKATEYQFLEEDTDGVNPKYVIKDSDGVEWKVKIGREARPEIAATRLVWAIGFHTHEDYFVPSLRVTGMPDKVRGQSLIGPGGTITNARLRRIREKEKKVGFWNWDESPYAGTREFNALRTLMAVLNNWDIKDTNTAIIDNWASSPGRPVRMYMASDLGSSFGSTQLSWDQDKVKGNLEEFTESKFITEANAKKVSFSVPGDFRMNGTFVQYFFRRPRMWITRDIPRQDAKWLGELMGRLTPAQIRDAFKGAGYSRVEADLFARVVERRIVALRSL